MKTEHLRGLFEKYGDFELTFLLKGRPIWKKWKFYSRCTKNQIETANQRTIFKSEIVLDVDNQKNIPKVIEKLKQHKYSYERYGTKSKGEHIHMFFPELDNYTDDQVNKIKKKFIRFFDCDLHKASTRTMIALEYAQHWKSGMVKEQIEKIDNGDNKLNAEFLKALDEKETFVPLDYENIDIATEPLIQFCMNNIIEKGGRNNVLFKNLAVLLVKSGLNDDQIKAICNQIVHNCPGKNINELIGWINKVRRGEITHFNKFEINKWSETNGYGFQIPKYFITLEDVHNIYKKWFKLDDMNRIDVILATALTRKLTGTPVWLILISNSGDMKTEQIVAMDDYGETTKNIYKFTARTLVSGNPDAEDLAPKLDGKTILITDMAQILTLRPEEKAEIWGALRNLYDGRIGVQSGMGKDVEYTGLRVTLIAGSTPAIDDQILIHQSLGTRELLYRPKKDVLMKDVMKKVLMNEMLEEQMRRELNFYTTQFLKHRPIKNIELNEEITEKLMDLSEYIAILRASAPLDFSGELRGEVNPEMPTRVLKQLKRLFVALISLSDNYSLEKTIEIIKEVVDSSIDPVRKRILEYLLKNQRNKEFSTTEVSESMKIGKKTAKAHLSTLMGLGFLKLHYIESENKYGVSYVAKEEWSFEKKIPFFDVFDRVNSADFLKINDRHLITREGCILNNNSIYTLSCNHVTPNLTTTLTNSREYNCPKCNVQLNKNIIHPYGNLVTAENMENHQLLEKNKRKCSKCGTIMMKNTPNKYYCGGCGYVLDIA